MSVALVSSGSSFKGRMNHHRLNTNASGTIEQTDLIKRSFQTFAEPTGGILPLSKFISSFRGPRTPLEICLPVIMAEECDDDEVSDEENVHHPLVVTSRVSKWIQRWGQVVAVPPNEFLQSILKHRGYDSIGIPSFNPLTRK